MESNHKFIRRKVVEDKTGMSLSTINRLEKAGIFPRRVKISKNIVAWPEAAIDEWIQSSIKKAKKA